MDFDLRQCLLNLHRRCPSIFHGEYAQIVEYADTLGKIVWLPTCRTSESQSAGM